MIGRINEAKPFIAKKKNGNPLRRLLRDWSSWILIVPTVLVFFFFPGNRSSRGLCSLSSTPRVIML